MTTEQMKHRLAQTFPAANEIVVTDLTGTQDHWDVFIRAAVFGGLTRIARQRLVMDAFAAELKTGEVHALSIRTES